MKCINTAWDQLEGELRKFLLGKVSDAAIAEDLLQDVFVKAIARRSEFCELDNSRAWLYKVTRNRLIDYQRTHKIHVEVDEQIAESKVEKIPVVNLSKCLPTALKGLSQEDKHIIEHCDLEGQNQADYAAQNGLTLVAAKSRVQRARKRLKKELHKACKIILDEQGNVCCFDPECQ